MHKLERDIRYNMNIEIKAVDYNDAEHAKDLVMLLNAYALDPMGGGEPLSSYVQENLAAVMAKQQNVFSYICYVGGVPAGLINCVTGFSTFSCKPLVNIHDVVVLKDFRGQGLSELLFARVEEKAKALGCCKVTLEVLEGNDVAQRAYQKFGYSGYELDPTMGKAIFWQKKL